MKIKSNTLTIVVNTCDAYSDVLPLFFAAFDEYWPECEYPVVINTETNDYSEYLATVHKWREEGAKDRWGERLIKTLKSVDSEFVLMLYDDFILESVVDLSGVNDAVELLKSNSNMAVAYLVNTAIQTITSSEQGRFIEIKDHVDYKHNSAPAIWRKSLLISYTGFYDNPWAWEVFGSYRSYSDGNKFCTLNPLYPNIYPYNYSKGGAIYRGKWVREVVIGKIAKYKLPIDARIRGFSEDDVYEPRSLIWKLQFMIIGFRMVRFKSLLFVYRYIKIKLNDTKH
jgi:hypothetical protein